MLRRLRDGCAHSPHALALIAEHLTEVRVRAIIDSKTAELIATRGYRNAKDALERGGFDEAFLEEVGRAMEDAAHLPRS